MPKLAQPIQLERAGGKQLPCAESGRTDSAGEGEIAKEQIGWFYPEPPTIDSWFRLNTEGRGDQDQQANRTRHNHADRYHFVGQGLHRGKCPLLNRGWQWTNGVSGAHKVPCLLAPAQEKVGSQIQRAACGLKSDGMPTSVRSHTKINLGLAIGPLRPDGFHQLTTVYQTLALHDMVTVEARIAAATRITLSSSHPRVPTDAGNTAWRMVERCLDMLESPGRGSHPYR